MQSLSRSRHRHNLIAAASPGDQIHFHINVDVFQDLIMKFILEKLHIAGSRIPIHDDPKRNRFRTVLRLVGLVSLSFLCISRSHVLITAIFAVSAGSVMWS